MLEKIASFIKGVFTIDEELKRLREESKEHSARIQELAAHQARLYYEIQFATRTRAKPRHCGTNSSGRKTG